MQKCKTRVFQSQLLNPMRHHCKQ